MRTVLKFLTSGIVTLLFTVSALAGTITGIIQSPQSGPVRNGTFTLTLNQAAMVAGTANIVPIDAFCYTDGGGNVVGEPNPQLLPVVTSNLSSGTLGAGIYFVRLTYQDATGETVSSPEVAFTMTGTGTLIVQAPVVDAQPPGVTAVRVYISTASGTETLQGSVSVSPGSWGNYSQTSALVAGASLPLSNTTVCKLRFNDEMTPSFTGYNANIVTSSGQNVPGFPQLWYLSGGSAGTINLSSGTPLYSGVYTVIYPQAIVNNPPFNATQSINGGLNLNGFPLLAGSGQFSQFAQFTETTAPLCAAGQSFVWADSGAHRLKHCDNGGGAINFTSDTGLTTGQVPKANSSGVLTPSALTDNGSVISSTEPISGTNAAAGNLAMKYIGGDHIVFLSTLGNDSNDGLSAGSPKLTAQAAFNLATNSGSNSGTILVACGSYAGPTTWYSNLKLIGMCSSDNSGPNFGVIPSNALPGVQFTYSSTQTITSMQNTFISDVEFEFANSGAGMIFKSISNNHFSNVTFDLCGNSTTQCVLMTTIDSAGPGHNTDNNVFRDIRCIANNNSSNAKCLEFLGAGNVNCSGGPCAGVTLNYVYGITCAGGVLTCVDFELNSDSNRVYGINCNQDLHVSGDSCLIFNSLTPASDQDADGELVFDMCATGTFTSMIRAGQTTGSQVLGVCNGVNGIPPITVLGGTPQFDTSTIGLPGTTKATLITGTFGVANQANQPVPSGCGGGCAYIEGNLISGMVQGTLFGTPTAGAFALSAGFGTGATVTSLSGTVQTVLFTITGGTGPSANPTITYTFPSGFITAPPCDLTQHGGTGTTTIFTQNSTSTAATTFGFVGTPGAGSTYTVMLRCGP